MPKVVILDGSGPSDSHLAPILDVLSDLLERDGSVVETLRLREMKFAHCLGCFGCWLKTPGMCVEDDCNREIAKAAIASDVAVLFTPVTFGGYSPELKKMLDHFIQLIPPYFAMDHEEVHHPPRYPHRPRMVTVGVQRQANEREAHIFKTLAGRNAINFHPPSYAAEVVVAGDPVETLENRLADLLARSDALPFGDQAASLMPPMVTEMAAGPRGPKRALLVVGSPKTGSPSTSSILGGYLLECLSRLGWETESLTLRASLAREGGESALFASFDRARLILLAAPLYSDALPYLVTRALTVIAAHRRSTADPPPQRLVAMVNSGFPEPRQSAVAMAICREFAAQSGLAWAGGLVLGGGGYVGTEPLAAAKRSGPSVSHLIRALQLTASDLTEGGAVPAEAVRWFRKVPVPFVPFALWRWLYMRIGAREFEREAARNGVAREKLLAQPYAA